MFVAHNLSINFSGTPLFQEISFVIGSKERVGLTGKNGAGKSTLFKLLNRQIEPHEGSINIPANKTVGYLPQQIENSTDKTVFEATKEAFTHVLDLRKQEQKILAEISNRDDYHTNSYLELSNKLNQIQESLAIHSADKIPAEIEKVLKGLGFKQTDFQRKVNEFSGGWRMRIELAKILLKRPDLLLLDEPTNHLDIESVQWLENFLKNYFGALILISHDRAFLDNVTGRTMEIAGGTLYDYNMPFSKFEIQRKERIKQQKAEFQNRQKQIDDIQAFISRFRYQANKASQVQSRIKQLEKLEQIRFDAEDFSDLQFNFPPPPPSGEIVFEAEALNKSYGDLEVLKNLYFTIEKGNRIAFAGKNGQGKTTLVKIIIGQTDFTGKATLGHNVKIGYFAQNTDELLDQNKTVLETLDDVAVGEARKHIRDLLGQFLFHGDDVHKPVKVLSGGERNRLTLAKLMLEPYNLLILDEPTNHLDILSKDRLKKALQNYTGTLIIVSHDRYFLDGLTENIWEFEDKTIKKHSGDIKLFLEKINQKQKELLFNASNSAGENASDEISDNKKIYLLRKEIEKQIRKVKKDIQDDEKIIEQQEAFIENAENEMATGQINDDKFYTDYNKAKEKLEKQLLLWEQHNTLLEELTEKKETTGK